MATQQPKTLALQRIDKLNELLDLAPTGENTNGLDALLDALLQAPGRVEDRSQGSTNFSPRPDIDISLIVDGVTFNVPYNPRLPDKALFNALLFMKDGNFWYAEFLLKRSLDFKNWKTRGQAVNETNRHLLSYLMLAQYAQGKYGTAIETALRLYETGRRKDARKLTAQITVKIDAEIMRLDKKLATKPYDGFVKMSDATKSRNSRLSEQIDYLMAQRVYAGRALNYMKGNDYLWEATRKSKPETKEKAKALLT